MSEEKQNTVDELLKDCPCTDMFSAKEGNNCCQDMLKHCGRKGAVCGLICLVIFVAGSRDPDCTILVCHGIATILDKVDNYLFKSLAVPFYLG